MFSKIKIEMDGLPSMGSSLNLVQTTGAVNPKKTFFALLLSVCECQSFHPKNSYEWICFFLSLLSLSSLLFSSDIITKLNELSVLYTLWSLMKV